jgi:hypothetical protein
MKTGSMERTLTPKTYRLRDFSQWTAATTLVATGALALFSAATLEKLSQGGSVSVDLQAFHKLSSATLSLDRVDEQRLLLEDARLQNNVAAAAAEKLPATKTAFKRLKIAKIFNKKGPPLKFENTKKAVVLLSSADAREISELEHARDSISEDQALAGVYQNLKFRFYAAAERVVPEGYEEESIAIAQATESYEYDELPEFNPSDFSVPETAPLNSRVATQVVETAPAGEVEILDQVSTTASSSLTASAALPLYPALEVAVRDEVEAIQAPTMNAQAEKTNFEKLQDTVTLKSPIVSPGLDQIPEPTYAAIQIENRVVVDTHSSNPKKATGPPSLDEIPKTRPKPELHAKSLPDRARKSAEHVTTAPLLPAAAPTDLREYSKDIASIYEKANQETSDYPDQSERVVKKAIDTGVKTLGGLVSQTVVAQNYGNGVSRDKNGITIDWNPRIRQQANPKITISKPDQQVVTIRSSIPKAAEKNTIATSQASTLKSGLLESVANEPVIDTKKCETVRIGVEAFNAGAEKDPLAICRRELSLEGSKEGNQARWWESYENEKEHWPTLSYLKPGVAEGGNRIPLLSTASIRILSAISKTNTHIGTGILFGEVPRGLEIQLLGRSDSPIYLDAGMRVRSAESDQTESRQFIILNVEPGQPLLVIKNREKKISGAIPLVVKSGMATHLRVPEPKEADLKLRIFDASVAKETRLPNLTVEIIGQAGKMGITDRYGDLKISKVTYFEGFPIYVDVLKNEKSYKNRYRVRSNSIGDRPLSLYYFDEKRVNGWLTQLSGGLSPYSGIIAGIAPSAVFGKVAADTRHLKIGILEKKSSLVPERYMLTAKEQLVSDLPLTPETNRYIGVQIPEGPAIPTIVDSSGGLLWSELVYAQPGVINVISPDL